MNYFILVITLFFLVGCKPEKSIQEESEKPLPPLDPLHYPASDKLLLGKALCLIQGSQSTPFVAPYSGVIKLNVDQAKTTIDKDFIWGEMSAEEITADIKAHLDQKHNLDLKQSHYEELEKPKEILQLERELTKAKENLKSFELIFKEMDPEELNNLIPQANQLIELDPKAYDRSQKEVMLLQKALAQLENNAATPTELNFLKERKQWDRKLQELERKKELSQFKAPFQGELTINFPLFQDKEEYTITTNQKIANLRSFDELLVQVKSIDPRWLSIPENELYLTIKSGAQPIEAKFHEKRLEDIRMKEEMVLYFRVNDNLINEAKKLVGSSLTASIWKQLEKEAVMIPKFALFMHHPYITGLDWEKEISSTFPGYDFYAEGDTSVAIIKN